MEQVKNSEGEMRRGRSRRIRGGWFEEVDAEGAELVGEKRGGGVPEN